MSVSVLILTYNESLNIGPCLDSVAWCDDVVVLDSHSVDDTIELARAKGARVIQRKFDDYASQRNFALREIAWRHPWLLMLDADERVPPDLHEEMMLSVATAREQLCLFRMRRRDHLYGRWIRRSSGYPTWFGRLMRIGRVWIERAYNEEYCTDGEVETLRTHLDHYPFNKGFHEWIQKHDRYSTAEANILCSALAKPWRWREFVARDPQRRRLAMKQLVYAAPARPLIVFLGLYIARGGFLEGRAGLTFSLLRAWYEFMIDCKCVEFRRRQLGLTL